MTVDRTEAEVRAADEIKAHKTLLILARNAKAGTIIESAELEFAPDRIHHLDDGTIAVATETTVTFFDQSGTRLRVEGNKKTEKVGLKTNTTVERAFLLSLLP